MVVGPAKEAWTAVREAEMLSSANRLRTVEMMGLAAAAKRKLDVKST